MAASTQPHCENWVLSEASHLMEKSLGFMKDPCELSVALIWYNGNGCLLLWPLMEDNLCWAGWWREIIFPWCSTALVHWTAQPRKGKAPAFLVPLVPGLLWAACRVSVPVVQTFAVWPCSSGMTVWRTAGGSIWPSYFSLWTLNTPLKHLIFYLSKAGNYWIPYLHFEE